MSKRAATKFAELDKDRSGEIEGDEARTGAGLGVGAIRPRAVARLRVRGRSRVRGCIPGWIAMMSRVIRPFRDKTEHIDTIAHA